MNKKEVQVLQDVVNQIETVELNDLQLSLVGGGGMDVVFA